MDSYESARLISAAACGAQLGTFLMLSLLNRPLLANWPENLSYLWIFKRFYRLNTVLSVLAGILAVLGQAREPGVLLAILGISYVLAHMHLLKAITRIQSNPQPSIQNKLRRSPAQQLKLLKFAQQSLHLLQILSLIYLLSRLT